MAFTDLLTPIPLALGIFLIVNFAGIAALKRGHEHHFSTSFWVANERRPR